MTQENKEVLETTNIVDNQAVEETIGKDNNNKPQWTSKAKANDDKTPVEEKEDTGPKWTGKKDALQQDNVYEGLDVADYTDILGSSLFMPTGGVEEMNRRRAELQSGWVQAGNMLGQAALGEVIGGTLEGFGWILEAGNVLDVIAGNEVEWGNVLTEAGKDLREFSQDAMPIYSQKPGKFDPSDSGWWFSNGVSVASTLSMLLPSMAATKALGFLGKGASKLGGKISRSLDVAANMGKKSTWMTEGISQAIVSRHIENSMEASGTFESAYQDYLGRVNKETGLPFSDEEARQLAAKAAASNYNKGWAMLLQDIPQYLALGKVFNPISGKMENALSAASKRGIAAKMKPWQQKVVGGLGTFASEGFEESYQYYISEQGKALADLNAGLISREKYNQIMDDAIGSDEMMTSAFFGGLGGNLFQVAGKGVNQLSKGKKRRASEKEYESTYKANLHERGKQFMANYIKLADADQKGNLDQRDVVIDEMMLGMTVDALHQGKYDEHIESLRGVAKMSKEELAEYAEKGMEINPELAQKYIPEIIKKSDEMRLKYLKYSNKYDANIAASMARNDYDTKRITEHNAKLATKQKDLIFNIPGHGRMSTNAHTQAEGMLELVALKKAKQEFKHLQKNTNKVRKPHVDSLIKDIDDQIKTVEKRLAENKLDDPRDAAKKREDARLATGYDAIQDELIEAMAIQKFNDGRIFLNQKENLALKNKEYQEEVKKEFTKEKIRENINTQEDVDEQREFILNQDKWTEEEKKKELAFVAAREAEISEEQLYKNEEAKQKAIHGEKKDEVNTAAKDTRTITNRNTTPVKDNIEDEFGEEETNVETLQTSNQANLESKIEAGSNMKILPINEKYPGVHGPGWRNWLFNGEDKTGKKDGKPVMLDVVLGDARTKEQKEAIDLFNNAKKTKKNPSKADLDKIYHNLPMRMSLTEDIWAGIPAFNAQTAKRLDDEGMPYHFRTNELPKRKTLINELLRKGKLQLPVTHQFGGNLVVEETEDGAVPENNIMDMAHIQNNWGKVDLMVTNEYGTLVRASDKSEHPDFEGFQIKVKGPQSDEKNPVPYKGGVFLNVPKANGDPFPLKLNLRRPTTQEAAFIADLLLGVVSDKEMKFGSRLSDYQELYERFRDDHPAEFAVLGKDAKVGEVAKLFVHMTPETEGKETHLHLDGGKGLGHFISYGTDVKMAINEKNAKQNRDILIGFIENNKRRQLNLKQWNDPKIGKKYREFVVNNVLSTDAQTGTENTLFNEKKTLGRNNGLPPFSWDITVGMPGTKPVKPAKEKVEAAVQNNSKLIKDVERRKKISENAGEFEEDKGSWVGAYVKPSGVRVEIRSNTQKGVKDLIALKYKQELVKSKADPAGPAIVNEDVIKDEDALEFYESLSSSQKENPDFYTDPRYKKGKELSIRNSEEKELSSEEKIKKGQNDMAKYEQLAEDTEVEVSEEVADAIEKENEYKEKLENLDDPDIIDTDDQGDFTCF